MGRFKVGFAITSPVFDRFSPGLISAVSILMSAPGRGTLALRLDVDAARDTDTLSSPSVDGSSSSSVSSQATFFPSAPLIDRSSFSIHSCCSRREFCSGGTARASAAKSCSSFKEIDSLQSLSQWIFTTRGRRSVNML